MPNDTFEITAVGIVLVHVRMPNSFSAVFEAVSWFLVWLKGLDVPTIGSTGDSLLINASTVGLSRATYFHGRGCHAQT